MRGLYQKARQGLIKNFTGISDPYEVPRNPDLRINTEKQTLEQCVAQIIDKILKVGILTPKYVPLRVPDLVTDISLQEKNLYKGIEVLQIDSSQVEVLRLIADGWAYPLQKPMNEDELFEVLNTKQITDETGKT